MGAAQDLLAELEAIGAVGAKSQPAPASVPPAEPSVSEVTVKAGSPGPVLRDARGARMLFYTERAVELLTRSIEIQAELRDVFIELHDLWVEDEAPGDGEGGPGDEEPEEPEEEAAEEEQEEEAEEQQEEAPEPEDPVAAAPAEPEEPFDLHVPPPVPIGQSVELPPLGGDPAPPVEPAVAPGLRPAPRVSLDQLPPHRRRFFEVLKKDAAKTPSLPR